MSPGTVDMTMPPAVAVSRGHHHQEAASCPIMSQPSTSQTHLLQRTTNQCSCATSASVFAPPYTGSWQAAEMLVSALLAVRAPE